MKSNYSYILFTLLLLFAACREKEIVEIGGTGVLKGAVACYDSPYYGSNGDGFVNITVEGTEPLRTLQTDAAGNFQIDNLRMGTYNLVFERAGYGTSRVQGLAFVGGDEPLVTSFVLYKLPAVEITDFKLNVIKYNNVWLDATVQFDSPDNPVIRSGFMRFYLSDAPDVSPTRYRETMTTPFDISSGYARTSFTLNTNVFPSGTDLYVVAYPCADEAQNYIDMDTGTRIFTSVGPKGSSAIKILVP